MKKTTTLIILILSSLIAKSQDISGKDFWFTFPQNNGDDSYLLIINSQFCTTGSVTFPAWGSPFGDTPYSVAFTVAPGTATSISIPITIPGSGTAASRTVYQTTTSTVGNKGFHIVTDSVVQVVAVAYIQASVDGEDVLPTTQLGTSYVVNSRSYGGLDGARFTVGATENGTNIQIKNSVTGGTTNITLNAGETYMVLSNTNNCNSEKNVNRTITDCRRLTASTVTSDKPIYVIGHTICSNMLWCGACDVMMAEFLPTSSWGGTAANPYVTAQAINRNAINTAANSASCLDLPTLVVSTMADLIEITGPAGTVVTVNNVNGNTVLPALTNLGGTGYGYAWYQNLPGGTETNGRANTIITATNPVQIVQYSQGYQTDASIFTDPEAILVYPKSTWTNSYIFSTSSLVTSLSTSIAIVVENTGGTPINNFQLDGAAIPNTGWSAIGTGGANSYRYKIVNVSGGAVHCIKNTGGTNFGFYVNNIGTAESYTTQGGSASTTCTYHACVLLPIGLNSFLGRHQNNENVLEWKTGSETNNDYFTIERSLDGINFQNIGTVKGSGNSSVENNYSYLDPNITTEEYYYRLYQVDFDGRTSVSENILIKPGIDKSFFWGSNYNLQNKNIELTFNPNKKANVKISLYDLMGRKVLTKEVANDQKETDMDVSNIPSGIYFLNLTMNEQKICSKILIH